MTFKYRATVLKELAEHGVIPGGDTPPELIHQFVNDLYLIEIRSCRGRMKSGLIPKAGYARHVELIRNRYPILSLPIRFWTEPPQTK